MDKEAKYVVRLGAEERSELQLMVDQGSGTKETRRRAMILLRADQGSDGPAWTDVEIAEAYEASLTTIHRVRQRFVEEGFEASVYRKPATDRQYRKLSGEDEATLIATASSQAPEGRGRWTLELLAQRLVALRIVESISVECVRQTLKKTTCSLT